MTELLAASTYIAKSSAIAARHLGDETMIMSAVDSTLFSLNPTASIIWEAADGHTQLSSIIEDKVCAEFEVSPEEAAADAIELIETLAGHGILLVSNQPIHQQEAR
jgi:hypothetical protein